MDELSDAMVRAERRITLRGNELVLKVVFSGPEEDRCWQVADRSTGRTLGNYWPQRGRYKMGNSEGECNSPYQMLKLFAAERLKGGSLFVEPPDGQ